MDTLFWLFAFYIISSGILTVSLFQLFSHYLKKTYNLIKSFLEAYYEN